MLEVSSCLHRSMFLDILTQSPKVRKVRSLTVISSLSVPRNISRVSNYTILTIIFSPQTPIPANITSTHSRTTRSTRRQVRVHVAHAAARITTKNKPTSPTSAANTRRPAPDHQISNVSEFYLNLVLGCFHTAGTLLALFSESCILENQEQLKLP